MANENIFSGIVFDDGGKGNKYQPDVPAVGATEMKAILDALPDHIINQLNTKLPTMSQRIVQYVGDAEAEAGLGNMNTSDYCVSIIPIVKSNPDFDVIVFDMVAYNSHFESAGTITFHSDNTWSVGAMSYPAIYNETLGRWECARFGIAYTEPPDNLDTLTYGEPVLEKKRPVDWALVADNLSTVNASDLATVTEVATMIAPLDERIRSQVVEYATLSASIPIGSDASWTYSDGVYSCEVDVEGVLAADNPRVFPDYGDGSGAAAISTAWNEITCAITYDDKIKFICAYSKPEAAIPIIVEIVRPADENSGGEG